MENINDLINGVKHGDYSPASLYKEIYFRWCTDEQDDFDNRLMGIIMTYNRAGDDNGSNVEYKRIKNCYSYLSAKRAEIKEKPIDEQKQADTQEEQIQIGIDENAQKAMMDLFKRDKKELNDFLSFCKNKEPIEIASEYNRRSKNGKCISSKQYGAKKKLYVYLVDAGIIDKETCSDRSFRGYL
jgi:hypothetical protein